MLSADFSVSDGLNISSLEVRDVFFAQLDRITARFTSQNLPYAAIKPQLEFQPVKPEPYERPLRTGQSLNIKPDEWDNESVADLMYGLGKDGNFSPSAVQWKSILYDSAMKAQNKSKTAFDASQYTDSMSIHEDPKKIQFYINEAGSSHYSASEALTDTILYIGARLQAEKDEANGNPLRYLAQYLGEVQQRLTGNVFMHRSLSTFSLDEFYVLTDLKWNDYVKFVQDDFNENRIPGSKEIIDIDRLVRLHEERADFYKKLDHNLAKTRYLS
jgi:hypothetical protein